MRAAPATRRLAALVLLLGLAAGAAGQEPAPPAVAPAARLEAGGGAETAFVGSHSYASFIRGHAWILSLEVAEVPAYGGRIFVLSEIDGRLTGELLAAPGPAGTRVLTGPELARYLERVGLSWRPLRALFERHYQRP